MRNINFTDLVAATSIMCLLLCSTLVLQIIIITKATIPADQVLTEMRAFREQVSAEHAQSLVKLGELTALVTNRDVVMEIEHARNGK
jgi:hypothetical protein